MKLKLGDIVRVTQGKLESGSDQTFVSGLSTDTRAIKSGDIYVALTGPKFDGNNFVGEAFKKGAKAALVSVSSSDFQGSTVLVGDTLYALGEITHFWRSQFDLPIIAVTGSAGKTTTKEMLRAALAPVGQVLATEGNLNNLIGLPLTISRLTENHKLAVWEMGMNAFGEIARLTEIARPTIGLITNVGRAHLEGVGSIEGVARAKGELFLGLDESHYALVNADDPYVIQMPTRAKKITFGFSPGSQIRGSDLVMSEEGMMLKVTVDGKIFEDKFMFVGEHLARNWLAVCAVAHALDLSQDVIREGIKTFMPGKMRGETIVLDNGALVVNDAYNANPESMKAAFGAFYKMFPKKRKIVLLGEMFELGDHAASLHQEVGREAARLGIDLLYAVGGCAEEYVEGFNLTGNQGRVFASKKDLAIYLKSQLGPDDVVLVKGSRGSKMEEVVELLKV